MRSPVQASRLSALSTATLLLSGAPGWAQTNILNNPSFEGGAGHEIPGWSWFENAYASNNGDEGVWDRTGTGTGVAKLFGNFWGPNNFNVSGFYQKFGAIPGATYQFHVWSYQKTGDDLSIGTGENWVVAKVPFFNSDDVEFGGVETRILDKTFAKDVWIDNAVVTAVAPPGTVSIGTYLLFLQPNNGGGAGFFDDASFVQLPAWSNDASGNWSNPANWGLGGVPNAPGAHATLTPITQANRTVTVDGPNTVGTLILDGANGYTLAGPGPLSLAAASGRAAVTVRDGTHTINTTLSADSPLTITLSPTGSLTYGPSGNLDLKSTNAVIDYTGSTPSASVVSNLLSGRAGGNWNGSGIISSTAAADSNDATAIAWAEAADLLGLSDATTADWNGQTVDATSLLLKCTYYGDLNFDGRVNGDDYTLIDRARAAGLPAKWINGDVNYDGSISAADYALMDAAFLHQGGVLSPETLAGRSAEFGAEYNALLATAIPEPGVLPLVSVAGLTFVRRRRHHD